MPGIAFDIVGESIGKPHLLQELFEKAGFHTFYVTPKKQSLLKNIKEKLFLLPDDTKVYSGHGPETTIGEEKMENPFVGGSTV